MTDPVFGCPRAKADGTQKVSVKLLDTNKRVMVTLKRCTVENKTDKTLEIHTSSRVFSDFDTEVIRAAYLNRVSWFHGREVSLEDAKRIAKSPYDEPRKVVTLSTETYPKVFDTLRTERCFETDVVPGALIDLVVSLDGVYFSRGRFEARWSVKQVKVYEPKLVHFAFLEPGSCSSTDESEPESL